MYDEWSRYWPTVDHSPFADFINGVKKYVVTSTPLSTRWHNSEASSTNLSAREGTDRGHSPPPAVGDSRL